MKNKEAIDQESNGVDRRSFIAKTIFAGAGLAALAASQNELSAQTRGESAQRTGEKLAADPLPGRRRLGKLEVSSARRSFGLLGCGGAAEENRAMKL